MEIAYCVSQLVDQYKSLRSGHFFDKDTMRFFKSKVLSDYKRLNSNAALFITSEVNPLGKKAYTVRMAKLVDSDNHKGKYTTISIKTVTPFHSCSKSEAINYMNHLVMEKDELVEIL